MEPDNPEKKEARVIKASGLLQAKVGTGPMDERVVERCQQVIDTNTVDFAPLGKQYLDRLAAAVAQARSNPGDAQATQNMTEPVMQLKAHAATFHYPLVGQLANIMLAFLENIRALDTDVLDIVAAHHQTLSAIITKNMRGDGGAHGLQLQKELQGACQRYFEKKKV